MKERAVLQPHSKSSHSDRVGLIRLFLVFFRIGAMAVGGGSSGWIHREIVTRLGWLTNEDFLTGVAIAQALPGVNTTNMSVYIGVRLRGWLGAVVALSGFLLGPFSFAVAAAMSYHWLLGIPGFNAAMEGVAAVALGMTLRVALLSARRCAQSLVSSLIMIAVFVGIGVLHWPLVPVVLALAPIGVFFSWPKEREPDA